MQDLIKNLLNSSRRLEAIAIASQAITDEHAEAKDIAHIINDWVAPDTLTS